MFLTFLRLTGICLTVICNFSADLVPTEPRNFPFRSVHLFSPFSVRTCHNCAQRGPSPDRLKADTKIAKVVAQSKREYLNIGVGDRETPFFFFSFLQFSS
ncbi:hypothetical protein, unlikely [Trypanosoma brucei gambiense DAL972]|uniref:T. brucei spp.-specific protein n=1 Tax=Trypanosoma brucei gambiense (strain MHOM/CI/86/DAL972) TaxID=679716 RepID=D0A555_TRYB9|nr:hypothetical protein, unlikely [Trypanosoma brucei gambiense DAL972]CBH16399.1 hypothetical protein, unlikely [Trypanosoma brucei gambiense DAL972]|eukprot:XP_011778663.1 hypothetical protein, unlikely [Trypanosoma brucei gambiense DAL972]